MLTIIILYFIRPVLKQVNVVAIVIIFKIHIKWHETCKCECRLDAIVCNNKQRWNNNKYRCECKELVDKSVCNKGCVWNSSNCECKCDKSCNIGECLDYENCKCRKRLVDKLIDECDENIS